MPYCSTTQVKRDIYFCSDRLLENIIDKNIESAEKIF